MWCTTECWDCEDRKCEHYISKTELYFENQRLKDKLQQKENIRKEVREKIESVQMLGLRSGKTLIATLLNDILEILDKDITEKSDCNYEKAEKENK